MKALDVAKLIVNKSIEIKKPVSNLQLQKLAYFVQLEGFKNKEKRLIDEDFEAWDYGPVCREIYDKFCIYGANPITIKEETPKDISKEDDDIINKVINSNKNKYPWELVARSHIENGAWDKTYRKGEGKKSKIKIDLIQEEARSGIR